MNEDLDIKELAKYIYQKRKILIYILLISLLIGMLYTFVIKKPQYEITAEILIDKSDSSIENFVSSKDLLKQKPINTSFTKTSKIINISTISNKENLEQSYNNVNSYIQDLQLKLQETYEISVFNIIEKPEIPDKAYNVSYLKDIGISLVAGIIVYGAYIMIMLTTRGVTNSIEIENITKINVLGSVSLENRKQKNQKISYNTKNKKNIEEIKRVEANIEFNKENRKPKTILLIGTDNKVGTTYITNNLANQYSKLYNRVLVIDTDIKEKALSNFYNKDSENGITNVLELKEIEQIEKFIQKTENENVFILPVGNNVVEEDILLQEDVKNILEELKKNYDIILIDSPSINNHIIPIHLTAISDATAIVIESGKTKYEQIQKTKSTIENVGGKITGIIINKTI